MARGNCDVEKELRNWLAGATKVIVAGIGNPIRTDDSVGLKIVQNLKNKVSDRVLLIECETVPESFVQQIVDFGPTHVLLIDAAVFGSKPGSVRLVDPEQLISSPAFSTHMLPLRIFCEFLTETTNSKIVLLLIEPKKTAFGEGLTPEIDASAQNTVDTLLKTLP